MNRRGICIIMLVVFLVAILSFPVRYVYATPPSVGVIESFVSSNLALNPGFEDAGATTDEAANWSKYNELVSLPSTYSYVNERTGSQSNSGLYSYHLNASAEAVSGTLEVFDLRIHVNQTFSSSDVLIYNLSFSYYLPTLTSLTGSLGGAVLVNEFRVRILKSDGTEVWSQGFTSTTSGWVSVSYNPNVQGSVIDFYVWIYGKAGSGTDTGASASIDVYIDDVVIQKETRVTESISTSIYSYRAYTLYSVQDTLSNTSVTYVRYIYPSLWTIVNVTNTTHVLSASEYMVDTYNSTHNYIRINNSEIVTYGTTWEIYWKHESPVQTIQVYEQGSTPAYHRFFDPGDNVTVKTLLKDPNGNLLSGVNTTLDVGLGQYTQVKDLSGLGNHGTIYGGATTVGSPYDDGVALKFDGSDDYVQVGGIDFGTNNFGIEVMFKIYSYDTRNMLVTRYTTDGSSDGWDLEVNILSHKIRFILRNGTTSVVCESATTISLDTWYHVFVYRIYGDKIYLYVNGVLENSTSDILGDADTTNPILLGRRNYATLPESLNGIESMVRIYYNITFNSSIVTQNYYSVVYGNTTYVTSGLVLYFEFGEYLSPAEYTDLSGNGNDGVGYNGVERVLTPYGWAWNLDGQDDYIKLPNSISGLSSPTSYTIVVFSKHDNVNDGGLAHDIGLFYGLRLYMRDTGDGVYHYGHFNTSTQVFEITTTISSGTWYMWTAIWNGSAIMLYKNTTLVGTVTGVTSIDTSQTAGNAIGYNPAIAGGYLDGSISLVMIYYKPLNSSEVQQNFHWVTYHNTTFVRDGLVLYLSADSVPRVSLGSYSAMSDANGYAVWNITLPSYEAPINLQVTVDSGYYRGMGYYWIYTTHVDVYEFTVNDTRTGIGSYVQLSGKVRMHLGKYASLNGYIWINGTQVSVSGGSFTYMVTKDTVGRYVFTITGVSFEGVSTYRYRNASNVAVIWDKVIMSVTLQKAIDYSGNGNDGTVYGARLVNTSYGWAWDFDGQTDYIETSNLIPSVFSVEVFVKIYGDTGGHQGIVAFDNYPFPYMLRLHSSGYIQWEVANSSGYIYVLKGATTYTSGSWYHLVGVYNSTHILFYINSTLVGVKSVEGPIYSITKNLQIGLWRAFYNEYLNGSIVLVRIYNRALTLAEIQQNYYSIVYGNMTYVTDGLVLYLRPYTRVNKGTTLTLQAVGKYAYDGTEFTGSYTLNDTTFVLNSVGAKTFTVSSITDTLYGITAFESDSLTIIWDALEIYDVNQTLVENGQIKIQYSIRYKYDGATPTFYRVSANGTISNTYYVIVGLGSDGDWVFNVAPIWGSDYEISVAENYVLINATQITEPTGNVFVIINTLGRKIVNTTWVDTEKDLVFIASGDVEVYVGNMGTPKYVIVDNVYYTDWSYNSILRKVIINNLASNVVLDYEKSVGGGGGGGGGGVASGGISSPTIPQFKPDVRVVDTQGRILGMIIGLFILAIVVSVYMIRLRSKKYILFKTKSIGGHFDEIKKKLRRKGWK